MRANGYADSTSRNGTHTKRVRNSARFKDIYGKDAKELTLRRLKVVQKQMLQEKEYQAYLRGLELEFKAKAWVKEHTVNENPDRIVINCS
jgi:hypothetical protein